MPEALSPADRSSLAAERGSVNMTVLGLILADRGPGVTYDALCARIEERIHLLPGYRRRLEQPPLGLVNPVWVDDEQFSVRWHVRQAALPGPAGDPELAEYVAREASRRMDRTRPLWELHLIEGLPGDRVAIVVKMHHALVDGMAAAGVAMILLDPSPEPLPVEAPPDDWEPRGYDLPRHLRRLARTPLARAQRLAVEGTGRLLDLSARSAATDVRQAADLVRELARSRPRAPALPINGALTANRAYAFTSADLAPIKAAGKARGGTVNDAILAAVAGMLGGYLDEPPSDAVALVPVSVRREGDAAMGNRISVVFVDLPVGEADPGRRIELVHERMSAIKGSAKVTAGALLVDMSGVAPPLLSSVLAAAGGAGGAFNLVVSNVPGPQFPLYISGSRVHAIHPVVPLNPADQRLNVGVFSYDGRVCFGLTADAALEPGVAEARAALDEALAAAV